MTQQLLTQTFRAGHLDVSRVRESLWRGLQEMDGHLQDLPSTAGCGEAIGGHLVVRFAADCADTLFACEVLDRRQGSCFEMGFAKPEGQQPLAFWRHVSGSHSEAAAPALWTRAVEGASMADHTPKVTPSFLLLAGVLQSGPAPMALIENTEAKAMLADDLAYWRGTAKSQARVIERLQQAPRYAYVGDGDAGAQMLASAPTPQRTWTLRDLGEWAGLNEERIIVLPRAVSATRKSEYQDAAALYAALELLASTYRLVKLGQAAREQLQAEADALRMELRGSVEPFNATDEYFVRWAGRRRFLDQHICKGGSRDPRFTLRVYFTWDEELKKVIVGWCPGHLSNSQS